MVSGLVGVCALEKMEDLETDQTMEPLETLMAIKNLPKHLKSETGFENFFKFFCCVQRHRSGEFCKVLESLERLERHHRLEGFQIFHRLLRHQSLERMLFRIPSSSFRLISNAFFPASLIEAPM